MEKSKLMMIIIIVLLVVLLGTVVGVSFFVLNMVRSQTGETVTGESPIEQLNKTLSVEEITDISLGDPITTNLAVGEDGKNHVAKIGVLVGYDNTVDKESAAFETKFTDKLTFARSVALACIHSKTYEELNSSDGFAKLAEEIKTKLQDEFNTTLIVSVHFNDWVLN